MYYRELARMISCLSSQCCGARLDRVTDAPSRVILSMTRYVGEGGYAPLILVIDFLPCHLDVYPVKRAPQAPVVPQGFTMLLRKYLESRRVASIRLSENDRIVTIEFGPEACPSHALIAELTGAQSNVFLIDLGTHEILGAVWQDRERRESSRAIHDFYLPPPPPNKLDKASDRFAAVSGGELLEAMAAAWTERDAREALEDARCGFRKRLKQGMVRLERRMEALYRDLEKADTVAAVRHEADLLSAYAWQLEQGSSEAQLPDFETGETVVIALDSSISIRENIERRYTRCKRATRALPQISSRLEEAEKQHAWLADAMSALQMAASVQEVKTLETKMGALLKTLLPRVQAVDTKKRIVESHKPYKVFQSRAGVSILVGKSAQDNDTLTFRVARGNDWWLHAAHVPGSHVVVKSSSPDQETLLDAATLAVHYSKLAQAKHAEVHATQQKYVRRVKGAPAGKVEIRQERVMAIDMEEARVMRLLKTENNQG